MVMKIRKVISRRNILAIISINLINDVKIPVLYQALRISKIDRLIRAAKVCVKNQEKINECGKGRPDDSVGAALWVGASGLA